MAFPLHEKDLNAMEPASSHSLVVKPGFQVHHMKTAAALRQSLLEAAVYPACFFLRVAFAATAICVYNCEQEVHTLHALSVEHLLSKYLLDVTYNFTMCAADWSSGHKAITDCKSQVVKCECYWRDHNQASD